MRILKFLNKFSLKRKSKKKTRGGGKKNKTGGGKKKKKNKKTAKEKSSERSTERSTERLTSLKKKFDDARDTYMKIEGELATLYKQLDRTRDQGIQASIMSQIKEKELPDKNAHEDLLQAKMEYESVATRRH
jgi:tRNA/tmRNA/rRNA uracil-C5-methylase (TrmA/RlmC/RlmD family)